MESIFLKSDPVWIILLLISSVCLPILSFPPKMSTSLFSSSDDKDHSRCFQEISVFKRISIYSSRFLQVIFLQSKGLPSGDSFPLPDPSLRLFL